MDAQTEPAADSPVATTAPGPEGSEGTSAASEPASPASPPEQTTDGATDARIEPTVTSEDGPVRYEIVFDCRDRMVGGRLTQRIVDVIGPTFEVTPGEEGPTWSVAIEFPSPVAADRFFTSDFYRQFCIEARRSAHSSVLVVPLGPIEG